jgi:hypothetical protein
MEYLAYGFAALLVLCALGLGFTLLLLPPDIRHYSLIVAPWVGYCYGTLVYFNVYEFGGRITPLTAQMVLLPPILCLIVALFLQGFTRTLKTILGNWNVIGAFLLAGTVFVFNSIPVLWYHDGPTTVTLFNHDLAHYAAVSRFFVDFTRTSSEGLVGQSFRWFNEFPTTWQFGPTSVAAFLGVYLGIMPDQDTTLCVNLFAALGVAGLFLLLYDTFKARTKMVFLGMALLAFHPAIQYLALEGFFAQVIAMGLTVMIFWVHSKLVESVEGPRHLTRYVILLACFTFGLLLSYQQMLPFVWIVAGIYSVVVAVYRRSARPIWISATGHLVAFAAFAAFCFPRFIEFASHFKRIVGFQAGWFLPFFSPDYLAGLSYQNSPFSIEDPRFHLVAAIAVSTIAFFWILATCRKAGATTVGLWIACCVVYAGAIFLAFHSEDGQIGGYKSFKFATYFLPFFVAAFVCLFDIVPVAWTRLSQVLKLVVLVSLSAGYVRADTRLLEAMRVAGKRADRQYRDLLNIDRDNRIESVNVMGPDGWDSMWAAYFLMHKKLYMEYASYWPQSELKGTYDLQDNKVNAPVRHLPSARVPEIRRLNDRLYLIGPFPKPETPAP